MVNLAKDAAPVPAESPETLRKQAEHARWLADCVAGDIAADRLRDYAAELDARAAAVDANGGPKA